MEESQTSSVDTSRNTTERPDVQPGPHSVAERITLDTAALTEQDYRQALAGITAFNAYLDQQPYMREFQLTEPSGIFFSKLIQKLLDNPPMVTGETKDLYNILKNTTHFFRTAGSDNLLVLKTVVDREKGYYEEILADFYTLSHRTEELGSEFSLRPKADALYEYAGFFLTTMGGRLYLFRRDAGLRMLITYYSILIVEEANRLGKNRHGIEVRPAVDNLISEMENGGTQLRFKEHYLDNLYDLKEKYL